MPLPTVSIVVPTLNSVEVLEGCLASIALLDYPPELIEVIIADGGSQDGTLEIAERYTQRIVTNPLRTGEAGKAIGAKNATHEIVAFIDSDNILPDEHWLHEMVAPFVDSEILASEPLYYTYRRTDGYITRYCALLGMNDPLCLFLGNYDRLSQLTGRWTEMQVHEEDRGGYLKVGLSAGQVPTIGANGFLIRRAVLESLNVGEYLFDIDVIEDLAQRGPLCVAKVKTGIVHLYCTSLGSFVRKQRRRVRDFLYYRHRGERNYQWSRLSGGGLARFLLYTASLVPLLAQAAIGYTRVRDRAWFFHPVACWATLLTYGWASLLGLVRLEAESRRAWGQ